MHYALIAENTAHSISPELHQLLGPCQYDLINASLDELPQILSDPEYDGFNITIPYKRQIIGYLDRLDLLAQEIGSVNTVMREEDGSLCGYNTDHVGMLELLRILSDDYNNKKVLVLGSGGTSATACNAVRKLGGTPIVISRGGPNHYGNLDIHRDAEYLINTTPVGMYDLCDASPVDLNVLPRLRGVVDAIYTPLRTRLLQQADSLRIPSIGGLRMLVIQATAARAVWEGKSLDIRLINSVETQLRKQMSNIVLIGMPGCGKTAVGQKLSESLNRPFYDTDALIEQRFGRKPAEIIQSDGEPAFRAIESEIITDLNALHGSVIATGGGSLMNNNNAERLRQNGVLCYLDRPLSELEIKGRPLSEDGFSLESLWQERHHQYERYSDYRIYNNDSLDHCVNEICRLWKEHT